MKTLRLIPGFVFLAAACMGSLRAETPLKHIRVIVDTSASLHHTDPSGYVKLSTELFYDLALKELDPNDTFKVARFPDPGDPAWPKTSTPPQTLDAKYVTTPGRNEAAVSDFHMKMRALPYTSQWTYFSPCVQWALNDLAAAGSAKDNRVIVLITDGKPDAHAYEQDFARLQSLVKPLQESNIRVFVLAFGTEVNEDFFNKAFGFGSPSGVPGQAFAGADAGHLLTDMLEIFSRSFGFSRDSRPSISAPIDIAAGLTLPRAVVVALYKQPDQRLGRPQFRLIAPAGKSLGVTQAFTEVAEHDPSTHDPWRSVSYAYEWLEPPLEGNYQFDSNGQQPSEVAVLRPIRVQCTVESYQSNSVDVVMAGKPAPMRVAVSPSEGMSGDPGKDVRVHFYLKYFGQDDEGRAPGELRSEEELGQQTPAGRVFVIRPEFIKNPTGWPAGTPYDAYIDVVVTQFDTPVYRMGRRMHRVRVYPYVSVGVNPNPAIARTSRGNAEIEANQDGCVPAIQFIDNTGSLGSERYTLAARLEDAPAPQGAWRGARFRFDDMDFRDTSGTWQAMTTVERNQLTEPKHRFCVTAGVPTAQDIRALKVHFGLWRNGADVNEQQLNVVDDLVVNVAIAAPGVWQTWGPWIALLLTLLLMYLLYLWWRTHQVLPPDLAVALGTSGTALVPAVAPQSSLLGKWLGFPRYKAVLSLSGDREVGRVKPLQERLFVFRAGSGFQNVRTRMGATWTALEPAEDGTYLLEAGTVYQAGSGDDVQMFRIEYSSHRPGV